MSTLSTSFGFSLKWKRKDLALGHFFISLEQALKTHYIYLRHCIVIVVCINVVLLKKYLQKINSLIIYFIYNTASVLFIVIVISK